MKKNLSLAIAGLLICILIAGISYAQERNGDNRRPSRDDSQSITEEQKSAATNILSKYSTSTIDIKDLFELEVLDLSKKVLEKLKEALVNV